MVLVPSEVQAKKGVAGVPSAFLKGHTSIKMYLNRIGGMFSHQRKDLSVLNVR